MNCRVLYLPNTYNYCEYISSYFVTPLSIKINSASATVGGWGD